MPAITSRIDGASLEALRDDRDDHQHRNKAQNKLDDGGHDQAPQSLPIYF